MPLVIKGKLIDKSAPTICVPIVERTHEDIMDAARRLVVKGVDMVEWRADHFEGLLNREALHTVLKGLKGIFSEAVLLVTVRTAAEGGNADFPPSQMRELLLDIAGSGCPDIIDMEYFTYTDPITLVGELQKTGCFVITSHHDFDKTPSQGVMVRLMEEMQKADPDIVKLCVMPKTMEDVMALIGAVGEFERENPGLVLMPISMGKLGVITRIAARAFGCAVTFAAVDKESAPGQVQYEQLREAMKLIKEYYG